MIAPDGKKLLFVSWGRIDHANRQVYEMDLSTKKETRVTFQSGDVFSPQYLKENWIVYASSTDELKENPTFLKSKLKATEDDKVTIAEGTEIPTDLYLHQLGEGEISRITKHSGFDGWPRLLKESLSWTRVDKDKIYVVQKSSPQSAEVILALPARSAQWAQNSQKEKVWITYDETRRKTQVWSQDKGAPREMAAELIGLKTDLVWDPESRAVAFAFRPEGSQNFQLYTVRGDGNCLTSLTPTKANARAPAFAPDGRTLFYAADSRKGWQIYRKAWTGPCPAAP